MQHKYVHNPHHKTHKKRKKRNFITRFFAVIFRMIGRQFKVLWRVIRPKGGAKAIVKFFVLSGFAGIIFAFLAGIIALGYYGRDLPDPNKLIDRQVAQSTKIYDRTGENLLYEISGEQRRTIVQIEELPPYVPQAVIALEDKTFFQHSGFNYRRLAYAIFLNAIGKRGPGASTLTSQLVKNAILTNERKLSRKLKEWILTYKIEHQFSKDQILQLYLNEIPYGSNVYGIEAASNYYFGKPATDLTLEEAATMAAIIQLPTYYSPYGSHKDALLARKDVTLGLMQEQGYITQEEKDEAMTKELTFKERRENIIAPHFVFHVRELLVEKYGERMVNEGGLVVKTTLDLEKQDLAQEVVTAQAEKNLENYNASNAALVSMDPKTGEILAMIGSVDYFNDEIDGNVNVATRPRQPGSSFKPIVYTYAWQKGYTPSTVLFDVNTDFPGTGKVYQPKNYDLKEHGPISLRKALQGSLNIPAVKLLYLVGVNNVLDFANELGYTTFEDRSRFGLSLVLGGGEVTLLEHTAAFATFANEGMYHDPMAILEVKTNSGQVLDTFEPKERRVIDANIVRITSNVLSDNESRAYTFGLNNPLTLSGRPAAAKTGTTNDSRDAWTMGYTPSLVTGVWVGNNDFSEMKKGAGGSTVAAPIWQAFMNKALQGTPAESFAEANIPVPDKAVLSGKGFGMTLVTVDRASGKLATNQTPNTFRQEKLYIDAHSILYYVRRSDPNGPAPEDPASADSEFERWESAVKAWVENRLAQKAESEPLFASLDQQDLPKDFEVVYGLPPTEQDDVHVEANRPSVRITQPSNDTELSSRYINADVVASAPRGISRVEFYLDDTLIHTDSDIPYQASASLKSFPNGFYTFRAVAYDDIDNSAETSIRVRLQSNDQFVNFSWNIDPEQSILQTDQFPYTLSYSLSSADQINQITFFSVNQQTGREDLVQAIVNPASGTSTMIWPTAPSPGVYKLYPRLSVNREIVSGKSITIQVQNPPDPEPTEEINP